MIELAIFGLLMILVMGAVMSYGLNSDYMQQVTMHAQRLAMQSASKADQNDEPTSISHLVIEDRHLPDPANPFAIGQVLPFSSNAGLTRNARLDLSPENDKELPRIQMLVNGVNVDCPSEGMGCVTSAFRVEKDVPQDSVSRYKQVYGQVCDSGNCDCDGVPCGQASCAEWGTNPVSGVVMCIKHDYNVKIVDACKGEIVDRDGCIHQARLIVDSKACKLYCEKGKSQSSNIDCDDICEEPMHIPWYAQNAQQLTSDDPNTPLVNEATYAFPKLDELFADAPTMGLDAGTRKRNQIANQLKRVESASSVTSTTMVDWNTTTDRFLRYKPINSTQMTTETQTSVKNEQSNDTWSTPW